MFDGLVKSVVTNNDDKSIILLRIIMLTCFSLKQFNIGTSVAEP